MIFVFKIIIVYMESESRHFGNFPGNISITRQLRHKNKNQLSVPLSTLTLTPTHLLFPFPVPLRSRPIYLALSYILRALGENTHERGKRQKERGEQRRRGRESGSHNVGAADPHFTVQSFELHALCAAGPSASARNTRACECRWKLERREIISKGPGRLAAV